MAIVMAPITTGNAGVLWLRQRVSPSSSITTGPPACRENNSPGWPVSGVKRSKGWTWSAGGAGAPGGLHLYHDKAEFAGVDLIRRSRRLADSSSIARAALAGGLSEVCACGKLGSLWIPALQR